MYFYYISYCVYVCILINIISWNQIINNTIEEITYDGDIIEEERKKERKVEKCDCWKRKEIKYRKMKERKKI